MQSSAVPTQASNLSACGSPLGESASSRQTQQSRKAGQAPPPGREEGSVLGAALESRLSPRPSRGLQLSEPLASLQFPPEPHRWAWSAHPASPLSTLAGRPCRLNTEFPRSAFTPRDSGFSQRHLDSFFPRRLRDQTPRRGCDRQEGTRLPVSVLGFYGRNFPFLAAGTIPGTQEISGTFNQIGYLSESTRSPRTCPVPPGELPRGLYRQSQTHSPNTWAFSFYLLIF